MSEDPLHREMREEIFRHTMQEHSKAIDHLASEIKEASKRMASEAHLAAMAMKDAIELYDRELNRKYWSVPLPVVAGVFLIVLGLFFGAGYAMELFPNLKIASL
jgi:hypothetical protein